MVQAIYQASLVLHITGIAMMAGATLVDYLGFRKFWPALATDPARAVIFLETGTLCQRLMGIGMALIIISGVGMMVITHGVWGEQTWFRIKFVLLLIIIANGLGVRRLIGSRIARQIPRVGTDAEDRISFSGLQQGLLIVHSIQLALFIMVFVLSIFKFN